jgi:hypothetical protein
VQVNATNLGVRQWVLAEVHDLAKDPQFVGNPQGVNGGVNVAGLSQFIQPHIYDWDQA